MQVKIDLSEVHALRARADEELRSVPAIMKHAVGLGAAYERGSHAYRNRTGRLERSTRGVLVSSAVRLTRADLEMGMPYASYVVARGLSNIHAAARMVREQLEDDFEAMAKRIAR